jgi:hypothetical protein
VGERPVIIINLPFGAEILVPVDVYQASKQADKKRQRNVGASARFRLQKKEKRGSNNKGYKSLRLLIAS